MKTILMALLLLSGLQAGRAETISIFDTPVPTAAPTPEKAEPLEQLSPPWDSVTLKDGQFAEGKVRGYDAFFLEFTAKNGTKFHIPWDEISSVSKAEFSGDTALMRQYLKKDSVTVSTRIAPKNPWHAMGKAFWPGILLHGFGFQDAGNQEMFLSLAGGHLFGLLIGTFGVIRSADVSITPDERSSAALLANVGYAVSGLTWVIDIIGAPISAGNFNRAHGLTLSAVPTQNGAMALAQLRF